MFLINSKQLKEYISSFNIFLIDKERFYSGIKSLDLTSSKEEETEVLLIEAFFEKEIFLDFLKAKELAEQIIQEASEYEFYYLKLIGLLSYFELCIQLNTVDSEVDYDSIIVEIRTLLNLEELKKIGLLEKEIKFNVILSNYESYNGNYNNALDYISNSFASQLKFLMDPQKKTYFEVLLLNLRAYLNFNLGNYQDTILYMVIT